MAKPWMYGVVATVVVGVLTPTLQTQAYPGGVNEYVTDTGPFCASCHSSVSQVSVRNLSLDSPDRRDIEKVHYEAITQGNRAYKDLTPEQRKTLLEQIKSLDQKTSIRLEIPAILKPGQTTQAKVTVRGGDGPVVGVMLLDSDLRYQARPIASSGWSILNTPLIVGPDGKTQTTWTDKRVVGTPKNVNFVQIYNVTAQSGTSTVTYSLRAPLTKGRYSVAIAFLYGVEVETELGSLALSNGSKAPRGGFGGQSGRVAFSELQTITVR